MVDVSVYAMKTGDDSTDGDISSINSGVSVSPSGVHGFAAGSVTLPLTIEADTTVAGSKNGMSVIDNLAVTFAGPGVGSDDPVDLIAVSATVFDHANASFNATLDQSVLDIDFGSIMVGSGTVNSNFNISNLVSTVGFTAGLDLDSIFGSGETATLFNDLAPISNIAAGTNTGLNAFFDTSVIGSFQATYTLSFSDQDLPGALSGEILTLNLRGEVVPEPTALSLLVIGSLSLVLLRRRH